MEAFKFAFETVIIGLLALPWLFVMIDLAKPEIFTSRKDTGIVRMMEAIPGDVRPALLSILLFTLAYLLGSAVSPVSSEFLNDQDWIGQIFPTDDEIQVRVYLEQNHPDNGAQEISLAGFHPDGGPAFRWSRAKANRDIRPTDAEWKRLVRTFQFEEGALQLKGTDRVARLTRLHERLTVLQGATFSGFVLLLLCVFALCSGYRAKLKAVSAPRGWRRLADWAAYMPAVFMIALAGFYGGDDLIHSQIDDLPIMEALLLFLGIFGFYLARRAMKPHSYINGWTCLFALFFTVLVYGGSAWTEVSYDQQVYQTYQASTSAAPVDSEKPPMISENARAAVEAR